jgi:hypothetical protein
LYLREESSPGSDVPGAQQLADADPPEKRRGPWAGGLRDTHGHMARLSRENPGTAPLGRAAGSQPLGAHGMRTVLLAQAADDRPERVRD